MKSLLILGAILALQPAVAAPSLRILPLGDSITQGYQSSDTAGYRGPLWTLLKNAGYDVRKTDDPQCFYRIRIHLGSK